MIDLDHNATTQPLPEVVETVGRVMREAYANPGSRHAAGRRARQVLEEARDSVAEVLDALPSEVIFTSGGTEATNLALFGFAEARKGTILLPPGEHPATEQSVQTLLSRGWRRHTLPIDDQGLFQVDALNDVSWNDVKLATTLLAHNETGVVQDLSELSRCCTEHRIPLHVDAVQAVGKIEVSFCELGATTLALAAHKFHGPRGIGALLVADGVRLPPQLFGGFQEQGLRPGTECVALAAGMALALRNWHTQRESWTRNVRDLRDRLQARLVATCAPLVINGAAGRRLPNTLNVAFPGCDGDALLIALDLEGVACSLGSACASGSSEPAPILVAMGCEDSVLRSSLRLSLGADNTPEQIDQAAAIIARLVRRMRP